ncbi:MAG: flagellar motor switch protein FliG [Rhodospirillaceae bacterium]|nr:flagellar motor switch protein FliG [Rhodospirillaceae bacterium]
MSRNTNRSLSGPEKAAVMMLALGEERAGPILERFDTEEVRDLSQAMVTLGTIEANTVEKVFVEFADSLSSTGSLHGSADSTEKLLTAILPEEQVKKIMEEISGPAGRTMWDKLGNVNEAVFANYLKNEYPQTVAVVLSKIRPDHASRVLGALPESFAMEVVMRMLRMESVQREVLDEIERTLRNEFMANLSSTNQADSHEMMAEIFNSLDRGTENRFMTLLEERNRDSADKIKALMFTFEDLAQLDASGVQTLLRGVDKDKLGIALKGSSDSLKDIFFTNMSERAAKILREDMAAMGPVRLSDVDDAQLEIVNTAKQLAEQGEIMLAEAGEEDTLVY